MRRFATTTAVLLTAVVTGAVTAVAAEGPAPQAAFSDNDGQDAPAKADILKYSVKHGTTVKLAVRIRKATNPKTNEHWIQGFSNLDWELETTGDDTIDFFAVMSNSNGKLRGIVDLPRQPTPPAVCGKSEGVKARFEDGRYKLRFPRSCINDPAAIRAQAFMFFDKDPYAGGHGVEDLSDVTAFTPGVAFG